MKPKRKPRPTDKPVCEYDAAWQREEWQSKVDEWRTRATVAEAVVEACRFVGAVVAKNVNHRTGEVTEIPGVVVSPLPEKDEADEIASRSSVLSEEWLAKAIRAYGNREFARGIKEAVGGQGR